MRQFAFRFGTKNILLTKKFHGIRGQNSVRHKLGRSTVFLKKQQREHKKRSLVDIPSSYSNQFVAAEKK